MIAPQPPGLLLPRAAHFWREAGQAPGEQTIGSRLPCERAHASVVITDGLLRADLESLSTSDWTGNLSQAPCLRCIHSTQRQRTEERKKTRHHGEQDIRTVWREGADPVHPLTLWSHLALGQQWRAVVSLSSIWLCPGQDKLQSDARTQVPASREDGRPGVFRVKDKERNRWEGCHRMWSERPQDITTQNA